MAALTGNELLQLVKSNPGKSARQLAELAGYVKVSKAGQSQIKVLEFQKALLSANKIHFHADEDETSAVRGGRKANFRIQVQKNGNLLIGAAYTKRMGLEPGQTFKIEPGRKHLKLIQVEDGSELTDVSEAS
ncbi:MAG: AbrB family transcriptional regulator [Anaerolineae bacterium]|nr:AbrB family transcriptional regulator [Gloeobacterales cyanobacterium ES-bin-313]